MKKVVHYVHPYLDTVFIIVSYRCKVEHENCQRCHISTYVWCFLFRCFNTAHILMDNLLVFYCSHYLITCCYCCCCCRHRHRWRRQLCLQSDLGGSRSCWCDTGKELFQVHRIIWGYLASHSCGRQEDGDWIVPRPWELRLSKIALLLC